MGDGDTLEQYRANMRRAKPQFGLLIVSGHMDLLPSRETQDCQRRIVNAAAKDGGDLLFWHHPRVVQVAELLSDILVFFSLETLAFDGQKRRNLHRGGLVLRLVNRAGGIADIAMVLARRDNGTLVELPISSRDEGARVMSLFSDLSAQFGEVTDLRGADDAGQHRTRRRCHRHSDRYGRRFSSLQEVQSHISRGVFSFARISLYLCGGITGAPTIAALYEAFDVSVVLHNPLSPVSLTACLRLHAAISNFTIQGYLAAMQGLQKRAAPDSDGFLRGWHLFTCRPDLADRYVDVLDAPGFGTRLPRTRRNAPVRPRAVTMRPNVDGFAVDQ